VQHILEDLGQVAQAPLGQDADGINQTRDSSGGEGAPGEADEVDLVSGGIVVGDEGVGLAHRLVEALADSTHDDAVDHTTLGAHALVVVDNLLDAGAVLGEDGAGDAGYVALDVELATDLAVVCIEPGAWRQFSLRVAKGELFVRMLAYHHSNISVSCGGCRWVRDDDVADGVALVRLIHESA
jgi:hypothetical protein